MGTIKNLLGLAGAALLAAPAAAQIGYQPATSLGLVGLQPDGVATGDFNGANGPDFAIATGTLSGGLGPDRVEIFNNLGNGTFAAGQVILVGNNVGTAAIVAADLDGDLDLDLAVTLRNVNAVQVLINTGGVFALGGQIGVGAEPAAMAAADIDGDGDVDLVTSNRSGNSLSLLANNGLGGFSAAGTLATGTDPCHVALDDLNGDCRTDIAVAAADSRRVDVFFNLGAGTFGAPLSILMPGNDKPTGMAAADLDADGDVDLATTLDSNGIGFVVVLRNTGGTFATSLFAMGGINPGTIVAADLDGDGDKDLAAADEDAGRVSALPNLGAGTFGAAVHFTVGVNPGAMAAADFDGNGSVDLVTSNRDSSNASVLLNASLGGTSSLCLSRPNSVGYGARLDSSGSVSIAANSFRLMARCAPPNSTGLFFYGHTATNVPFGNGRLCVGSPIFRLGPPVTASATGHAMRALDFTVFPANSGNSLIVPGASEHFQFWYRNVAGGGAGFNTSEAIRAVFRP